jgi:hypothetical protein
MLEAIGSEIGQFIQRKRLEVERENLLLREKSMREQAEKASRLKDEFSGDGFARIAHAAQRYHRLGDKCSKPERSAVKINGTRSTRFTGTRVLSRS